MTDAYRTSGFVCPTCKGALREFQHRLVCDSCNGMMIAVDDFMTSIHELDGSTGELVFMHETQSPNACPRCMGPMTSCKLALGALKLHGTFLHCAHDGLWFARDAMTATFALVSRRGGFRGLGAVGGTGRGGHSGATSGSPMIQNMPSSHSGVSTAMASIQQAFGGVAPASAGLAISHWHSDRPVVHTLFVSAHKDRRLGCPVCNESALEYRGDRWACGTCSGSFVETAALEAMIVEMSQKPWDAPVVSGAPGERVCPICRTPMLVEVLEAVTIDRCGVHGVWFDDRELQTALHHASAEPSGLGSWLKHLFHRHGTTE